jgi:hypothetical protein
MTPLAILVLSLFALAAWLWGADSRPGFSDGRTDVKEHWFIHDRNDRY